MSAADGIRMFAAQGPSRDTLEQATSVLVGELAAALGVRAEGDIGILLINIT